MLLYLPYERNRRQWNNRFIILFVIIGVAWAFVSFKSQTSRAVHGGGAENLAISSATEGKLSLLTYNIAGLPGIISSAATPRASSIQEIGRLINAFDIVNVQEDFNYNVHLYQENQHIYRTEHPGGVPFGDGLSTLSKFPIVDFQRIAWKHCNGTDCLTPKGFSYARLALAKGVYVDVYNVHATSQYDPSATQARCENLKQLTRYIKEKSIDQALIVMGDFNTYYALPMDNVKDFQQENELVDTWVLLQNTGDFPEAHDSFKPLHALMATDNKESIDKIFFRNSDKLLFEPLSYKVEKELFRTSDHQPLSDHCALSMSIKWKKMMLD